MWAFQGNCFCLGFFAWGFLAWSFLFISYQFMIWMCALRPHRVALAVSFYLFWSLWFFSALYSSLTISDDLPRKICEEHEKYWQFKLDRRIIPTSLSLSFDPANQMHGVHMTSAQSYLITASEWKYRLRKTGWDLSVSKRTQAFFHRKQMKCILLDKIRELSIHLGI